MTILLGVFAGKYYYRESYNALPYHQFPSGVYDPIMERVGRACKMATKIIVLLDDINFPIRNSEKEYKIPYTCREIELICNNDEYFNKTVFKLDGQIVNFDKTTKQII